MSTTLSLTNTYGLVFFDIPTARKDVYNHVKSLVDKYCIPVNLSVYIFDWGLKDTIEQGLRQCQATTAGNCSIVKFDNMSSAQLELLAMNQLNMIFGKITARIDKVRETVSRDCVKRSVYKQLDKRLQDYENLATFYGFLKNVEPAMQLLRNTLNEEYKKLSAEDTVNS